MADQVLGTSVRVPARRVPHEVAARSNVECEIGYSADDAIAEARRGEGADLGPATEACPLGVDIGRLVALTAAGDLDAALDSLLDAHPWPGIVGRHCRRFCEWSHSLGPETEPLNISAIERAVSDHGSRHLERQQARLVATDSGRSVVIVGTGSAASAAAYRLRGHGHRVHMIEQLPESGGMLLAGYPEFRMPVEVLKRENDLEGWGVTVEHDRSIDAADVRRLLGEVDAVLLGIGMFVGASIGIPGEDLEGVWDALSFLTSVKLGRPPEVGRAAVVIGAGFTAQDAARTCRRLGADVQVLYRRSADEMPVPPQFRAKVLDIMDGEGAPYVFQIAPKRILGEKGRVTGIECVRTAPGARGPDGLQEPEPLPGTEFAVGCDTVIGAVGEELDPSVLPKEIIGPDGRARSDPDTGATSIDGLFLSGELTGLGGTIQAYAHGFKVADAMHAYLSRPRRQRQEKQRMEH